MFKFYLGTDPLTGKPLSTTRRGFKSRKEAQDAFKQLQFEVNTNSYKNVKQKLIATFMTSGLSITKILLKKVRM